MKMKTKIKRLIHINKEERDLLLGTVIIIGLMAEIYFMIWFNYIISN